MGCESALQSEPLVKAVHGRGGGRGGELGEERRRGGGGGGGGDGKGAVKGRGDEEDGKYLCHFTLLRLGRLGEQLHSVIWNWST